MKNDLKRDDLIRRRATANDLRFYAERKARVNGIEYANGILAAACRIEQSIPAVDAVEVVPGKWLKMDMHMGMENYKCSVCRSECYVPEVMGEPMFPICPYCGARMDGRREDGDARASIKLLNTGKRNASRTTVARASTERAETTVAVRGARKTESISFGISTR